MYDNENGNGYAGGEPEDGDDITEALPEQPDTDPTGPLPTTGGEDETGAWPDLPTGPEEAGGDSDTDTDGTDNGATAPAPSNRRRIIAGIGAAAAIAAALGLGAWALTRPAAPGAAPAGSGSSIARPAEKSKQVKVTLTVTAEGWTPECGKIGYAAVDADGDTLAEGEAAPGEPVELALPEGPTAVSATSVPTAPDGKTTWLPASAELTAEEGASVELKLEKVDLTDEAATAEAVEALPEAQRAAARATVEAKREDPSASRVEAAPARPAAPAPQHQAAAPSKPSAKPQGKPQNGPAPNPQDKPSNPGGGSSKPSQPEKVWGVVKPAWDEQVLVRAAWTETIDHPAVTHVEKVDTGKRYWVTSDNKTFYDHEEASRYCAETGAIKTAYPVYEEKVVTDKPAWAETIQHPAEYKTVHHEAEYGWV